MRGPGRAHLLSMLLLTALLAAPAATLAADSARQDALIIHVLNRIGYGPRPGDVERVRAVGLERYIDQQLHPEGIPDPAVEQRLAAFKTLQMTPVQLATTYPNPGLVKRLDTMKEQGKLRGVMARFDQMLPPPEERGKPRDVLQELAAQRLIRDVYSDRQLQQVMVDFWLNHFNVFWGKGVDKDLLTSFEMNVIRPHALGSFHDLLLAVAQSPAMLFYLDNWVSKGPNAPVRNKQQAAINENYARELMELHTLGVDGGYTQKDVIEVARCLTGWTIEAPRLGAGFTFRPRWHDNGQKVVLGHVIPPGGGIQDGLTVIDILSHHPSTARFIATKLCRRFVADDPPQGLVRRVAAVFMRTGGDIRETLRAIFHSHEFLSLRYQRAKVKTPLEMVVSSLRAVDAQTDGGRPLLGTLYRMGMPLYMCQPPTGYPDRAVDWVSTNDLLDRLSFAVALAMGRMRGTEVDPRGLLQSVPTDSPQDAVSALVDRFLGGQCSSATRQALLQAAQTGRGPLRPRVLRRMVALTLGSPEFQRK